MNVSWCRKNHAHILIDPVWLSYKKYKGVARMWAYKWLSEFSGTPEAHIGQLSPKVLDALVLELEDNPYRLKRYVKCKMRGWDANRRDGIKKKVRKRTFKYK